jgi:hypothetical protein
VLAILRATGQRVSARLSDRRLRCHPYLLRPKSIAPWPSAIRNSLLFCTNSERAIASAASPTWSWCWSLRFITTATVIFSSGKHMRLLVKPGCAAVPHAYAAFERVDDQSETVFGARNLVYTDETRSLIIRACSGEATSDVFQRTRSEAVEQTEPLA